MTFKEWYEDTYKDSWHEDYAELRTGYIALIEYEEFCSRNHLDAIYDG